MNPFRLPEPNARGVFALTILVSSLVPFLASCGSSGQAAAGPPRGAGAPVTVVMAVLQPKPVDRTSEYVATLRSRQTSAISPQVEGIVTRILVRSGQRVAAGAALAQVDPLKQEASVSSNEATRAAQEAQLRSPREELQRQKALFDQGLVSRQALDQANAAVDTAAASLKALQARERESRVELQYYRVTAPAAGVVGDIPVRVGDRVTTSTVITTISDNAGLEAYIYVPIERAQDLKLGHARAARERPGRRALRSPASISYRPRWMTGHKACWPRRRCRPTRAFAPSSSYARSLSGAASLV